MQTLSCIGAGLLGKTLCHLLSNQLSIQQVINRSMQSSQLAVDFIGAGRAAAVEDIQPADIWLIATPTMRLARLGKLCCNLARLSLALLFSTAAVHWAPRLLGLLTHRFTGHRCIRFTVLPTPASR